MAVVSLVAVIVAVVELIDPIVVVVVIVVEEVVLEDMEVKELGTISIVREIRYTQEGQPVLNLQGSKTSILQATNLHTNLNRKVGQN